jgi:methylated-DNA-[protein]-cysteine S-methyltransferase
MKKCINTKIGYITMEEKNGFIIRISFGKEESDGDSFVLSSCANQLMEYLEGQRKVFDVPILLNGTSFQKACWNALLKIEYGKTVSYSDIANEIHNPKALRAVGQAIHNNPIAIVVPCHRVIGKNKKLVGYAYGLDMKQELLDIERDALCL